MGSLCGSESGRGTWIWTWILAWTWIWTKNLYISCIFCFFTQALNNALCFLLFSLKSHHLAWSLRLKWSLHEEFLRVAFQKAPFFFSQGTGRRGSEGNSARHIEFSYHREVRTLNARRMFREYPIPPPLPPPKMKKTRLSSSNTWKW